MKGIKFNQIIAVLIWVIFVALAVIKGLWYLPAALFLLHLAELLTVGLKTGRRQELSIEKTTILCLIFGVTWWGPLKNKENEQ